MMTILVVFLLAHTAEVDILPNTKNISIPQSLSERKPSAAVVVMITKDSLYVDGELVGSLNDVVANQGPFFAPLKNALISAIGLYGNGVGVGDVGPATFSDHAPFNSAGYQAICFVEHNYTTYGCYHQPCDAVESSNYIQYAFASNLARSVAGWLADVAGASKKGDVTGNGVVDIDDLVAVITSWGTCPAPPAVCPADLPPSVGGTGDGVVNIDDLVTVITNWG
jgi:hypothetical protein